MIGTPVSCTLWHVHYRHRNVDPPRISLPGKGDPPTHLEGHMNLVTADATGAELCDVAAFVVLGAKRSPEHEFQLTQAHRLDDLRGLALVDRKAD
jgi:hypothetical protein